MNTLGEAYKCSGVFEIPSMKVLIQNEAGSFAKNFYDEKTLTFTGTARVSRAYPPPYGFHPQHDGRRRTQRGLFCPYENLIAYRANRRVRCSGSDGAD